MLAYFSVFEFLVAILEKGIFRNGQSLFHDGRARRVAHEQQVPRHEKSSLRHVKCVVKGFVKATFARFWQSLTSIKDLLWIHLCVNHKPKFNAEWEPDRKELSDNA